MPEVPLLELKNLTIARSRGGDEEPLLRGLSLSINRGQSLGLVGESGSGKSLTALAIMNLLPEPELSVTEGSLHFQGQDLRSLTPGAMNALRGSRMSIIVQDALAALNPVKRVQVQIGEIFRFHRTPHTRAEREQRIREALQTAGLSDPDAILKAYPHQLSGGMRQRVLLAMALLLEPELLIADEPTTALDVTLQARWVDEVRQLQRSHRLGLLFISHDLALVAELCDDVAVLYRGQLIEQARTESLMSAPAHPYTQAMLRALPRPGQAPELSSRKSQKKPLKIGCPYVQDCPLAMDICRQSMPELQGSPEHRVACHARRF